MELVLGNDTKMYMLESYKLGVTRMTEHFLKQDPPSKKELRRLESHIKREIKKTVKKIRRTGYSMVIGTSGSPPKISGSCPVTRFMRRNQTWRSSTGSWPCRGSDSSFP